ncbi:transcriptional repressor [bacterium]|nr:MAG: transcriptional repressor [bacterium]
MSRDRKAQKRSEEGRKVLFEHIKGKGLRWTQQRDAILKAFLHADAHLSAEELYGLVRKNCPEMGFATVYRCMNLFVEAGIAKERRFDEERVRYEPAVMAEHHDHLICTKCGRILEFEDERIEKLQESIAKAKGFCVTHHRMELYGLCPKCNNC